MIVRAAAGRKIPHSRVFQGEQLYFMEKGTAKITAQIGSVKATCTVTVKKVKAKSVKLNKKKVTVKRRKSVKLKATMKPKNATDTLSWKTSNKKVATVKNGKVTGKSVGKAKITVRTSSGKKAVCNVTVK